MSVLNESEERLTAQPEELPSDTGQLLLLLLLGLSGFLCFHLHVYLHSSGKALSSPVIMQIWFSHCLDCVPDIQYNHIVFLNKQSSGKCTSQQNTKAIHLTRVCKIWFCKSLRPQLRLYVTKAKKQTVRF